MNHVVAVDMTTAKHLVTKLLDHGMEFIARPIKGEEWEFQVPEENKKDLEMIISGGPTIIMYKGHSVRCYGHMNPDQSTWYATEVFEGILPRGFPTWYDAVKHFIDNDTPIVELSGV